MTNDVRFRSSFDDRVSSGLDRIRDKFDQLGKSKGAQSILSGVGLGAGVAAFGLLDRAISGTFDAIGGLVKNAQEEETGITRLGAALQANIPNWDGNTDAIERQIAKREDLAFSDDALRESLAGLVGATGDLNKAFEIQSTAMDLARYKGISLQEASEALTKVEAGSYRILKSLGIALKDGASQTEALAAVQKVAGGQAEAYGQKSQAAFERAQIKINDAMEEITTQALPVLTDLANTFTDKVIPAAQDFVGTIQDVLSPVAKVNDLLKDQGGLIGTVGKAWEFATGPLKNAGDAFFEIGYQVDEATGKVHTSEDTVRHAALSMGVSVDELKTKVQQSQGAIVAWAHEGEGGAAAMSRAFQAAMPVVTDSAGDLSRVLANEIESQKANTRKEAYEQALAAASGLISGQQDVESGAAALAEALKNEISGTKRIAKIEGTLTGQALADALASKDPLVRAKARLYKQSLEAQWEALQKDASEWGQNIGAGWISGIGRGIQSHYAILRHQLEKVESDLRGKSPPKTGPLAGLTGEPIGSYWMNTLADGIDGAHARMRRSLVAVAGSSMAVGMGPAFAGAGSGGGGGPLVVHTHVHLDGRQIAESVDRHQAFDLGRALRSPVRT